MKIAHNLFSMQISVPHSEYGPHEYFMPVILQAWVAKYKLNYEYTGGGSWGNGLTNGITNKESTYMIRNIQETDATAFRLRFPQCKVHLSKQYEYT